METFALVISTLHLGKPHRFYRAFNNLKHSPVSREVAAVAIFYNLVGAYAVLTGLPQLFGWLPVDVLLFLQQATGWLTVIAGPASLYFMHAIYRIEARPYWNHWQVLSSFFGSMFTLGAILAGLIIIPMMSLSNMDAGELLFWLVIVMGAGIIIESAGLYQHARYLTAGSGEAQAAHIEQKTSFGKTYWLRNAVLLISILTLSLFVLTGSVSIWAWTTIALLIVVASIVGRAMFYVMVIPTTMPGAFFWKNPAFEDHARETGLADMKQFGVQVETH
ncbi:MAG: dimethyl sulfoxide reductase anchor subunit [Gammaproteobacteria bacterium]|nr:dimethyl sulfoxide reductase anchor subunit [Gammaproteobacteria bacterium]